MKKLICLVLVLTFCLTLGTASALAEYYQQHQGNDATFETLEEARVSAPAWMMEQYPDRTDCIADPALDKYPEGTTYVYRSKGMFDSVTAASRMNTNLLVYSDKAFESKDAAFAYLQELGVIAMADEATGSVVLVTPIDATVGFGSADGYAFYLLQSAMCNIGFSIRGDTTTYYADASYFGGLTYRYLIGIDGGATFLNNYVSTTFDYISRIAGMLLVGGSMEKVREVAAAVPVWLVNPSDDVVRKYSLANETDSTGRVGDDEVYFNQQLPLKKVVVTNTADVDVPACVHNAYYDMFIHALRIPVTVPGLYTTAGEYKDYRWNQAPYSLGDRNPIINGVTPDGIHVVEHQEERFSEYKAENGAYINTWYEFLPEEVLNNTAPEHSVPFILFNHGGGDDPLQAVDEVGLLKLAGDERIAIIASAYQDVYMGGAIILKDVLPKTVEYMLETYPALDPARVYVTGYSMGGGTTYWAFNGNVKMFAAAVSMAGGDAAVQFEGRDELFADADIPFMLMTSTGDIADMNWNPAKNCLSDAFQLLFMNHIRYNEMETFDYDVDTYPISGFKGDTYEAKEINGEYMNFHWTLDNDKGVPMIALNVTEYLPHGLYQEYAKIFWDYVKHFSRNVETGDVVYNAYAN